VNNSFRESRENRGIFYNEIKRIITMRNENMRAFRRVGNCSDQHEAILVVSKSDSTHRITHNAYRLTEKTQRKAEIFKKRQREKRFCGGSNSDATNARLLL